MNDDAKRLAEGFWFELASKLFLNLIGSSYLGETSRMRMMDPTDIGLFHAAEQRLAWADRRQQLLAQNVANANTPGYQARDLAPFAAMITSPGLAQTSPGHLAGTSRGSSEIGGRPSERSPAGNTISVEDQLSKVADTSSEQQLVLNIHHTYQTMMRTALGRGG